MIPQGRGAGANRLSGTVAAMAPPGPKVKPQPWLLGPAGLLNPAPDCSQTGPCSIFILPSLSPPVGPPLLPSFRRYFLGGLQCPRETKRWLK